ncbi:MAG: cytochrome c oxidase subunit 3 [Gammaproteobacteria bacterium]|nr:cytochrome c oxidase subunit 3 [Gammaproteobacteria bacterium]
MSASATSAKTPYYFIPDPSSRPVSLSFSLFFVIFGATLWVNDSQWGKYSFFFGLMLALVVFFFWFRDTSRESEGGNYSDRVDFSYRWGMTWFIFSEVAFFGAFFSALWWARAHALPQLAGLENHLLWPGFKAVWPSLLPGASGSPGNVIEPFQTMAATGLPMINTALLLSSGVTMTIAHHALIAHQRSKTILFMWATVLLGFVFLLLQGYEYYHAYQEMNLKLSSGIYGSTFFMLTGFHGFHVFLGMLMLTVITLRLHAGHFSANKHFGFEGAAWYWHFVDVVWLGLYVLVYWL